MYITSVKTPKYKYRPFILYYGIEPYPVNIVVAREIVDELQLGNERIKANSEDEFIKVLSAILGSKKISEILKNLLKLNRYVAYSSKIEKK